MGGWGWGGGWGGGGVGGGGGGVGVGGGVGGWGGWGWGGGGGGVGGGGLVNETKATPKSCIGVLCIYLIILFQDRNHQYVIIMSSASSMLTSLLQSGIDGQ